MIMIIIIKFYVCVALLFFSLKNMEGPQGSLACVLGASRRSDLDMCYSSVVYFHVCED